MQLTDLLVPPHIQALRAYEPGLSPEQIQERFGLTGVVKLGSNENPLGVSPLAIESARRSLADLARYPDGGLVLRRKLAERFHLKPENVIAGAGSEGIMADIVRAFLKDNDEVLTTEAAFLGFQVLAHSRGVKYQAVPYCNWRYDLLRLADAITDNTKLIYLANPNNPTGTYFTREEFEEFYSRVPQRVLIILDEAYFEFAADRPAYPDSLQYRFDNVITLRTFSKLHGLAAARIGYGFAHENLISVLLKLKLPFEPSGVASAAALGALDDSEFVARTLANNAQGLAFVSRSLRKLGYVVVPSAANFVMLVLDSETQAVQTFDSLLREGIIIRLLAATGLPHCLRVSIGTAEENELCVAAFERVRTELEDRCYAASY